MKWESVIGLEVHAQLATASKIFSPAAAAYCEDANRQVREVDLGLPGALPTLNRRAVECAVCLGLAVSAKISATSEFARKNYFYPDLPKGYQISQFEYPIVVGGEILIPVAGDGEKRIGITRAHLEEDAGKLQHGDDGCGVDLNRAGVPLLEIVSEPDMRDAGEAVAYAKCLHRLVRWLGVCDGQMQQGSFRIDANISVRRPGAPLGTRCEIKNLNSFRFLEQSLNYEIARQTTVLEGGGKVTQETRLFESASGKTRAMRGKEDAHDYRYFPDPDLPPLRLSPQWIEAIGRQIPELPQPKKRRFIEEYGLPSSAAAILSDERAMADYFESTVKILSAANNSAAATSERAPENESANKLENKRDDKESAKLCANWLCGDLSAMLNKHQLPIERCPVAAENFADLLNKIKDGVISGKIAKLVLAKMWDGKKTAAAIIGEMGWSQIVDIADLQTRAEKIVAAHPSQARQYGAGKEKLLQFFVGQMMKETRGRANPQQAGDMIKKALRQNEN